MSFNPLGVLQALQLSATKQNFSELLHSRKQTHCSD